MSKSPKSSGDWRSGSEALFRAARRDDLDASAADCARVEAELARRIAAGAPPKLALGRDEPSVIARLARAPAPRVIAKLWVGAALLVAGSLALLVALKVAPARTSRPASSAPSRSAAPVGAPADAPREPATEAAVSSAISEAPAPRARERAHHELPARKRPSASRVSPSADSKPAPASADAALRPEPLNAQAVASRDTPLEPPASKASGRPPGQLMAAAAPEPAEAEAAARTPTPPVPVRVDASADARAELALVERMHAAMRAAKPAEALELCAEHAARWPKGVFSEEREAVSAIASCVLRADDAVSRARIFLSKHPHAPTAPRVAAACAPLSAAKKAVAPR